MSVLIWISVFVIFLYTMGFAFSLWKKKNKVGAIAVTFLAFSALVLPYFSYFQI
ncbi:hypothetical protein SAMN05192533_10444 [Mesobacillus persicus]|uniref:Uncharacterized protein n=1 Tax=Mesobacillus persicus TaxID=930146 RepID=A0A1H7ZSS5_9BACI|nr:hypothetical protein SAMN05192533_10444 [Mesobacillus persicus]